jgi:CheY-like chemotaxis protein
MDLEMPVVGGWEATRQLKSNPQTSDIPIIGLSAHAMAGEREKAVAAGCNEFDHTGRIRSSGRNNSAHARRQQSSTFSSTDSVSVKRSQLTSRSLMISPTTTHASTIPVKVD